MAHIVHSTKNLKRIQTKSGPRWYDTAEGKYAKYEPLEHLSIESFPDKGLRCYRKKDEYFKIELKKNKVIIEEGNADLPDAKLIKDFTNKEAAFKFYRTSILRKIKKGFRSWEQNFSNEEPNSKVLGKWGSKVISSNVKSLWKKKHTLKKRRIKSNKIVVPKGYIELSQELTEELESAIGHLAEFIKQGKRTKAIKDIRDSVKKHRIYQSIQYKVNYALDQYEEKGIPCAKWSLKKGHKLSKHLNPGTEPNTRIIKIKNLRVIMMVTREMLRVIRGLLRHHDPRNAEEVKWQGRKHRMGPILMRPKKKPTIRFFREGVEVYKQTQNVVRQLFVKKPQLYHIFPELRSLIYSR